MLENNVCWNAGAFDGDVLAFLLSKHQLYGFTFTGVQRASRPVCEVVQQNISYKDRQSLN